jgi:hypothetical protein
LLSGTGAWYADRIDAWREAMRLDPNPLFRKMIAPWYDNTATGIIVIVVMTLIMLFAWVGITTAQANPAYQHLIYLPIFLLLLCLWVCVSVGYRLARRYYDRHLQSKEI